MTVLSLALVLAACAQEAAATPTPEDAATPTPGSVASATATPSPTPSATPMPPTATPSPTPSPTPAPTPTPTPSPTPTPTPRPLTAAEIFERVSPSVVFIETPYATGSGFVIDGGYIVTNVHVTWPSDSARIVFPDGTALNGVEVFSADWLTDFALLGPVVTNAPPLDLVDGEGLPVGSDVYLIGYPAEVEAKPQPSLTKGIISRFREWTGAGITYIQTDAAITGGQSGGVLVSADADVIGISGLGLADFGLVASAADLGPRISGVIAGEEIPFGNLYNPLPTVGGQSVLKVTLESSGYWTTYVVKESATEDGLGVFLSGDNDGVIQVTDALGGIYGNIDAEVTGLEIFNQIVPVDRPLYVQIGQLDDIPGEFNLSSNRVLIPWADDDDGREIKVGATEAGNLDHEFDLDEWVVELEGSKTYEIAVDSALMDPEVIVGGPGVPLQSDDDSLGGLWGLGAQVFYTAPADGTYRIVIMDASNAAHGGYVLSVVETQ